MNILLWILQLLLALQFLQHGMIMVFPPKELVEIINANIGGGLRYFIGITELLAVIGLILPGVLGIYTWLIPLTALGLMIVTAVPQFIIYIEVKQAVQSIRLLYL